MTDFAARISRVRMKDGADVHIIEGWDDPDEETVNAGILRAARENVEMEGLTAFMVVGFHEDGTVTFSHSISDECPMARTLMPTYVAELVRRYALTKHEASEVFSNMFEWVE